MPETTVYQQSPVEEMQKAQPANADNTKHPLVTKTLPPGHSSVSPTGDAACHRSEPLVTSWRRSAESQMPLIEPYSNSEYP